MSSVSTLEAILQNRYHQIIYTSSNIYLFILWIHVSWVHTSWIHGYIHHGYMHHGQLDTSAWVKRPERPKKAKDEVKEAQRAADYKFGPGGPLNFLLYIDIPCLHVPSKMQAISR